MKQLRRADDGAVLLFALLIITTIALVAGALLTRGQGNLLATVQLRSVAGSAYASDTAAQMAIGSLELGNHASNRISPTTGSQLASGWVYNDYVDNAGCFGMNDNGTPRTTLNLKDLYPRSGSAAKDTSATVVCTKVQGSGAFGTGPGVEVDASNGRALTILGSGSGNELTLKAKSGNKVLVRGGVASNARLTIGGGLISNSYVWATECDDPAAMPDLVTSTPPVVCNHAVDSNLDPNLTDPLPAGSPVPPLRTKAGVVQHDPTFGPCVFQAGYYDDAAALTAATTACDESLFQPGLYYFDFHNDDTDKMHNSAVMDGSSVWTIKHGIVGGILDGPATPGRCVSPLVSTLASGVQFVFGGTSRLVLSKQGPGPDPAVELCGSYNNGAPPIVIYGKKDGDTADEQAKTALPGSVQSTSSVPAFDVGTDVPSALASIGGTAARWTASTTTNSTVNLSIGGFVAPSSIPEGSILTSAVVRITHRTTGTGAADYDVKVGAAGGPDTNATFAKSGSYGPKSIEVLGTLPKLARAIHDGTSTSGLGPTIKISQTNLKNVTLDVDAVTLDLTYIAPAPRGQNDSVVVAPASNPNCILGTCEFLSTPGGNTKSTFVVQGVTYLPNASIDLGLSNTSGDVVAFRYGLVARSLAVSGWPQYAFADPLVSIPETGPGFGTNVTMVDLEIYVCPGEPACSTVLQKRTLTVRAKITDRPDDIPAPLARKVEILSWSEQR